MGTNGGSAHLPAYAGRHRHICAFFNSIDEEHRVLRSFVTEGSTGEKAFHIVDAARRTII